LKIDGHTHSHFCPHGSGEHVEKLIERAIELGFDEYHITEHPPLPGTFIKDLVPLEAVSTITFHENETDDYIKEMLRVKHKYKDKLIIKIGFEIDFLPDHMEWTKQFLNEYGKYCDTGLLSVHFLKGVGGWRCVDYGAEDTSEGLVSYYGDPEKFQLAYYDMVIESINADIGASKPTRIGHMTLCNKFKSFIGIEKSKVIDKKVDEILSLIKNKQYSLDYNTAGVFKPYCGETYPSFDIVQKAVKMGIPFMYGSDAHGVEDVGRGYEVFQSTMNYV
jgi:histidinol-phosphatase (PHP family)